MNFRALPCILNLICLMQEPRARTYTHSTATRDERVSSARNPTPIKMFLFRNKDAFLGHSPSSFIICRALRCCIMERHVSLPITRITRFIAILTSAGAEHVPLVTSAYHVGRWKIDEDLRTLRNTCDENIHRDLLRPEERATWNEGEKEERKK